ncbi:MAG: ABC transporter ATP-binding protein [Gordonia sp. (in: high G+C Gram-positive bacteria)]
MSAELTPGYAAPVAPPRDDDAAQPATMPAVQLRGLTKRYGSLTANDNVSLTVDSGQIHAIIGENGAGKSTLMGMLSGEVVPDSGQVIVAGEDITGCDTRTAITKGIGIVHQHFQLVHAFTVAENIALGFEPRGRFGTLDTEAARTRAQQVSTEFDLELDPDIVVDDLPLGLQQRVEIVKTLTRDASVLIFDEPTAVLTEKESDAMFAILRRLRDGGRAIIFVTHKLREAMTYADQISVLRQGKLIASRTPEQTSVNELGSLMVGREVRAIVRERAAPQEQRTSADEVLTLDSVTLAPRTIHAMKLTDISLTVDRCEVLGLLGVDGNGQQEVISTITGTLAPDHGRVWLNGTDVTANSTASRLGAGLGIVPADRHREGVVLPMSIARNLILDRRGERRFTRWGGSMINRSAVEEYAREMIDKYGIRAQSPTQPLDSLSGGNQQKVVLAREMERDISTLVAAHPTRGLDVGSIEYVHRQLLKLATHGVGVLVVTSDIDEAVAISDRIAVICNGAITGIVHPPFNRSEIGILMGGNA